ncbi:beta-glucosidase [Aequitasia blattaphilus]|uniref:Glycoside hydrolase family 3 C-terminal domain-containing protein n=1 Tax=Aequitasia blattaphilus TaxID=2949332 RepID=A0ABT1EBK9_9FIRM|nr:glycoside hydrolase family 3 C-terminal domain-containing protein [Aequitasia blattaphilus]MCP1103223.1 glycoside hydrolase family 3 C-terminal domain-containing protein [Aequitasia blattaphilus]MCR8615863.1 glycoside hydrolase family 3 C-terminal domain-containing protein [Aequitasia blattaphilus]
MEKKRNSKKRQVWRGITTVTASLLALTLTAGAVVDGFRTDIDKNLGTQSTKILTEAEDGEELYNYTSDYANTTELLDAIEDLGERMNEEGSVLLKNNGALPLSEEETKKVSFMGFSSYYPVQGGDFGSSLSENVGTDADTVDMVTAFKSRGYEINPTLQSLYEGMKESFKSEAVLPWGVTTYYRTTAPGIGGTFTSIEASQEDMDKGESGWKESLNDYNVMIVTLARGGSENANYTPGKEGVNPEQKLNQTDPLGLSDTERDIINAAVEAKAGNNGKVVVLLNNASAMEIDEIKKNDGVDAILEIGLPGGYGFYGVADVLSGEVNPSGHLTDTYAVTNANSPAAQNYGNYMYTNADDSHAINSALVEAENIYMGYKYYETRYADCVLKQGNADNGQWNYNDEVSYPFGYGLSYTTFEQTLEQVEVNLEERTVTAQVTVKNTGDAAGKDVVELYVSLPYTEYDKEHKVEKSAIQLLDYGKTDTLEPGETVNLIITADAQDMTSWDSTYKNEAGTTGNYILDEGTYYFALGNGSHEAVNNVLAMQGKSEADGMTKNGNTDKVKTWELSDFNSTAFAYSVTGVAVENQLEDMDLNYYMPNTVTYLSRNDWSGTWPTTYQDITATEEMLEVLDNDTYEITENGDASAIVFGADNGLSLADLKGVTDIEDERWSSLVDEITLEESMIRTGFGGTSTKTIESIISPEVIQNDGPNGFNSYPLGQYANTDTASNDPYVISPDDKNMNYKAGVMSNATVIAQTFSKELATEFGEVMGNYSLWSNLTIFWGAGTNLHRTPYNARNHEYYSEDAVLTAYQAASFVSGGKKYGCIIAPKHFAFNDTEINRTGLSVFMTEQQARENELRGVQSAVEDAGALGIMTAYNRVGCTTDNSHYGLLQNILRKEWGFQGLMSEDFIQDAEYATLKEAVHCGVTMTCNTGANNIDAVSAIWPYWTVENVSKDATLLQDLKNAMLWQNYAIANSNAMDGISANSKIVNVRTWYDNALLAAQIAFALLTILAVIMYFRSMKRKEEV